MNLKNVLTSTLISKFTPRFAYTHIFIADESRHSMLHVQNPFAFFWPDGNPVASVHVFLNSSSGEQLGHVVHELPPFGTLALSISDVLQELGRTADFGTITVDIVPPLEFRKYLHSLTDGAVRIASPFWMRFFDEIGSQAYVHSIEADRTQVRGLPTIFSRILTRKNTSTRWSSDRTIRLEYNESAIAFIVNHSRRIHICTASWVSPQTGTIVTQKFTISPKGVSQFSVMHHGDVFLMVDSISTSNAKPYVLVQSPSRQFALTHG
jgi:hypothetical protein